MINSVFWLVHSVLHCRALSKLVGNTETISTYMNNPCQAVLKFSGITLFRLVLILKGEQKKLRFH